MRKIVCIILAFAIQSIQAQNLSGITHIPDTGFNLQAEIRKNIKKYPNITLEETYPSDSVIVQKDIVYKKINGASLNMDVFLPGKNIPPKHIGIIFIHGGGWRSGNKTLHHALAQKLASLGYTCFTPSYRLSTDALYPAAVYDIKSSIRYVREHAKYYKINKNKIVVGGHSAGGQLAALMGSTNDDPKFKDPNEPSRTSDKVNAVIDIDGVLAFIHAESGEGDESNHPSAGTYWFGYTKTERPDLWREASALTHVDKNASPLLFFSSSVPRMHAGRNDYLQQLKQYGIYAEAVEYSDAPHSFLFFNPWFEPMVESIDRFLTKVFN